MSVLARRAVALLLVLLAVACTQMAGPAEPDRFLVYFNDVSAELSPEARQTIAEAAQRARQTGPRSLRIEGRASTTGSAEANMRLSETRAAVVADALEHDGIAKMLIRQVPIGEVRSVDNGVNERRVDIVLER